MKPLLRLIIALLVVMSPAYADIGGIGSPVVPSNLPLPALKTPDKPKEEMVVGNILRVTMAADGYFHLRAEVNGEPVNFIIDTGAGAIVLSPKDAAAAGFDVDRLKYTVNAKTPGGTVSAAPVHIETIAIGTMAFHNLPALVNGVDMDHSLLGMPFLKKFRSYSVDDNHLTLTP